MSSRDAKVEFENKGLVPIPKRSVRRAAELEAAQRINKNVGGRGTNSILLGWPPKANWEQVREVARVAVAVGTAIYSGSASIGVTTYFLTGGGIAGAPPNPRGTLSNMAIPTAMEIALLVNREIREAEMRMLQGMINALYEKVSVFSTMLDDTQKRAFLRETLIPDFIDVKNYADQLRPEATSAYIGCTIIGNVIYHEAVEHGVFNAESRKSAIALMEKGIAGGVMDCVNCMCDRFSPRPHSPILKLDVHESSGEYYFKGDGSIRYGGSSNRRIVEQWLEWDLGNAFEGIRALGQSTWDLTVHNPYGRFIRLRETSGLYVSSNRGFLEWSDDESEATVLYAIEEEGQIYFQDLNRIFLVGLGSVDVFTAPKLFCGSFQSEDAQRFHLVPNSDGVSSTLRAENHNTVGGQGGGAGYYVTISNYPAAKFVIEEVDYAGLTKED